MEFGIHPKSHSPKFTFTNLALINLALINLALINFTFVNFTLINFALINQHSSIPITNLHSVDQQSAVGNPSIGNRQPSFDNDED